MRTEPVLHKVKIEPNLDVGWLTPGRFALLLAALVLLTFPGIVFGTRTFVFRDYGLFSYPVAFFHRQCFWRGELPLWNPLNYCGVPFLAQWNTMTLYPGSLIYLLLPLPWSLSFFCLAHVFWGGLGMYFLARDWTNHRLAASLAGVVYAFNGLTLNFLMWPSHVATFSWLPWMVWLVPQGWRHGGKQVLWGSMAGVMQMLAGGPETILLTWVLLFALACGDWMNARKRGQEDHSQEAQPVPEGEHLREPYSCGIQGSQGRSPSQTGGALRTLIALRLAGMALLVALICAAQLLPFLELLAHSQRDRSYGSASHDWSIPFWGWANFLVPLFRTSPTHQGVFLQNGQYWTSSYYAGIGTILLMAAAVRRVRDWRVRLLAGLGFLGLLLGWGDATELYRVLRFCFPGLGFVRYPVKFVILVLAVSPLLAACGLQALTSVASRTRRFEWICGAVLLCMIGVIIAVDWRTPMPSGDWRAKFQNGLSRAGFLVLVFILVTWFLRSRGRRRILWGGLLLGAFWLDLVTQVPTQNPTARGSVYSPGWARQQLQWSPQPEFGRSRVMVGAAAQETLKQSWLSNVEQNYLRNRRAMEVDCNLLDDVPHVDGFFSLVPRETYQITDLACGKQNRAPESLLDFLGVSEVTAPGALTEWTPRRSFMPLLTSGQRVVFADEETTLSALRETNLDLRQVVFLPLEARGTVNVIQPATAAVSKLGLGNQKISFDADCSASTVMVVSQAFYAPWKAYVDDRQVKIWRANFAFQALSIPAGHHQVVLRYEDGTFLAGGILSSVGIIVWFGLWRAKKLRIS
ncbi:MAG TPA: YfhO family protein [Candidatus Acidoferrum sp.]|nr:YfhO family protein [Candidatus Acidoferrum sp.]